MIAASLVGAFLLITNDADMHLYQNDISFSTHSNNRLSTDFNAPSKDKVFEFMDKAILKSGVNLIDTVS